MRITDWSSDVCSSDLPGLCKDRVRFVGDAVAFVVAETVAAAKDAAELIEVDYDPLPAVTDAKAALAPDAPRVWDEVPGNVCVDFELGNADAGEAAFAKADHVTRMEVVNNRVTAVPIETRGAIGVYDRAKEHYTLICSTQNIHANRNELAEQVLGIPKEKMRKEIGRASCR